MLAGYGSIPSPDNEPLALLEPLEDQSMTAAQKPSLYSIFQKFDEHRDGRISKEELIAVYHEFHINGNGRLPAQELGVYLPQGVGVVGTAVPSSQLQNAESNVEMMVANVGDGGSSAEDGGDSFDGAGVIDHGDGAAIVGDGGDANRSVLMWVSWNFEIIWLLLIRGMNLVKAGSFALCLLSFFFDEQLSFCSKDTLYLRIAFVCGLSAFFVAPWHVPDANSTLRDQDMQEIAVLTLLLEVLTLMVIALDKEFRVPILFCCLVVIRIGRGLEN